MPIPEHAADTLHRGLERGANVFMDNDVLVAVQQFSQLIRAFFEAYVREGFTEIQALMLCRTHVMAMWPKAEDGDSSTASGLSKWLL